MSVVERLDRFQQRHPKVGLPIAVLYKFFDDQGGYLAALITYYGFLSLFPLLLILNTVLNFVLAGDPELQQRVLDSALGQFPIVGASLAKPDDINGNSLALAIGIIGALYGGLGVAQAAQHAMNTIWRVPRNSRPNPLASRLRGLLLLVVVGLAIAGTTVLSALGLASGSFGANVGSVLGVVLVIASVIINIGVFLLGFRVATARPLSWQQNIRGAIAAAVAWQLLQYFGVSYVGHIVKHSSVSGSVFALVFGLMAWIYLEAVIVVFAVEYNAVRGLELSPRALLTPFTDDVELTAADEAAYATQAKAQRSKGFQEIDVSFRPEEQDDTR
jgi:membrane protein